MKVRLEVIMRHDDMNTKQMRITGLVLTLFILVVGVTGISPVRAAELPIVWTGTPGTHYIGGGIQNLSIDAWVTGLTGATQADYKIYYANDTIVSASSGTLVEGTDGHYSSALPVSLKTYNDGDYYLNVILDNGLDNAQDNWSFTIEHMFYFTGGPVASWDQTLDMVTIASVPFLTSQDINLIGIETDNIVHTQNVTVATCEIYNDLGVAVAQGSLTYNPASNQWIGAGISMAWKGTGNFYAVAEFTLTNGTTVTSPAGPKFQRANQLEDIITWIAIIGGIGAGVILVVLIYLKKHGSEDITRKEKKKEEKEIKVLEISDDEIKKAKRGKTPEPKVDAKEESKGVTKKSGDLIFEVPKWEEGDGEK